jgi:hypothetical protein
MISIYTSLYNLESGLFDWKEALDNFSSFADEVCVATTMSSVDDTVKLLNEYAETNKKVNIIVTNLSFEDYAFDGKLKNAALSICTNLFCMLLDGDERVRVSQRYKVDNYCKALYENKAYDAIMLPVIDVFNSEKECKSVGEKWYLHRNSENIKRGIVDFAKLPNGKIDHCRSDTCELIYNDGTLVKSMRILEDEGLEDKLDRIRRYNVFTIYHLGWLDKQKRLKANDFWRPVWSNRAGEEVKTISTMEELNQIKSVPHNLPYWNEA